MATFFIGELVRLQATFTLPTGQADPDAVYFQYRNEDGSVTLLEYDVDPELVKFSTGVYYVDIDAIAEGVWYWRWYSTGDGQAAEEGTFTVSAPLFP